MKRTILVWAGGLLVVLLFGLLVWPTLYRYDHIELGPGQSCPVRQNRITGYTEILFPGGWREAGSGQSGKSSTSEGELDAAELVKLDVRASLEGVGLLDDHLNKLKLNVYNGLSDVAVKEVTVEISVTNSRKETVVGPRKYRIRGYTPVLSQVDIAPLQSGEFAAPLGFDVERGQSWSYTLVGARGVRR